MATLYIRNLPLGLPPAGHICLRVFADGKVLIDGVPGKAAEAIPVPNHGPLVDVWEIMDVLAKLREGVRTNKDYEGFTDTQKFCVRCGIGDANVHITSGVTIKPVIPADN